ncbi:MAG: SDR family oxidoreductase [Spongiibacteraceae bacterium]
MNSSKGEVTARNIAAEFGDRNIRANAIFPGLIRTESSRPFYENAERLRTAVQKIRSDKRIGEPDDIAASNKQQQAINGETNSSDAYSRDRTYSYNADSCRSRSRQYALKWTGSWFQRVSAKYYINHLEPLWLHAAIAQRYDRRDGFPENQGRASVARS